MSGEKKKRGSYLKRVDGGFKNEKGVIFTEEEKAEFNRLMKNVKAKRMYQLKQQENIQMQGSNNTRGNLQAQGDEGDFVLKARTKTLQSFESKKDYTKYMKQLQRVSDKNYMDLRLKLYKRNELKAIDNVFGKEGKDIHMKIRMMKPAEFKKYLQSSNDVTLTHIYSPEDKLRKANAMRTALKMPIKD